MGGVENQKHVGIGRLLNESGRALFAIVDAAKAGGINMHLLEDLGLSLRQRHLAYLQDSRRASRIQSLYDVSELPEFRQVGPHLVAIAPHSPVLERLIKWGWGRASVVYLSCDRPFADVQSHLHKFLKVRTEDQDLFYFRFYDARVLRVFLPTCTPSQVAEFFGPITDFWVEGDDPNTCLVFRREMGTKCWPEEIQLQG